MHPIIELRRRIITLAPNLAKDNRAAIAEAEQINQILRTLPKGIQKKIHNALFDAVIPPLQRRPVGQVVSLQSIRPQGGSSSAEVL